MTTAVLEGCAVARLRLQHSARGAWWADCDLQEAKALSGAVSLDVAGSMFSGAIISGGVYEGGDRASYRIVGGAGGWGTSVASRGYANDAGVKTASVVQDVAREAGEEVADLPGTLLGPHYTRQAGPAALTINQLTPEWRMTRDGVAHFNSWSENELSSIAPRVRVDPGVGVIEIAPDDVAELLPGVRVDGLPAASDIEIRVDSTRLRGLIFYRKKTFSARLQALDTIISLLDPGRSYRGCYEYRVVTQAGHRLNLQPVRQSTGLPDLANVPYRPGVFGFRGLPALGSLVVVQFLDADPSRPFVSNFDAPDAPGWMPTALEFGDVPNFPVARQTDPIQAGPFSGTIVSGSTLFRSK